MNYDNEFLDEDGDYQNSVEGLAVQLIELISTLILKPILYKVI